jgi:hypothetical protein
MKNHFIFLLVFAFNLLSILAKAQENDKAIIHLDDLIRTGAMCDDGTRSRAKGAGACSNHGGVKYWFYAEKSIYKAYNSNLPAIPEKSLVRLQPQDVENILRLGVDVYTYLRKNQREKYREEQNYSEDEYTEEEEPPSTERQPQKPKRKVTSSPEVKSEKESSNWLYIALVNTLIVIFVIFLVFAIIFFVIRKLMSHED